MKHRKRKYLRLSPIGSHYLNEIGNLQVGRKKAKLEKKNNCESSNYMFVSKV